MSMERAGKSYLPAAPLGRRQLHHHGFQLGHPGLKLGHTWAQIGHVGPKLGHVVSTMCCHSRAQSPGTSTNHTNHMARNQVDSTSVSTRFRVHLFSSICYQTHTPHTIATPHKAGLNNSSGQQLCVHSFSFHLVSSICPDMPTHTHTLANAPWPTCAMESFVCYDAIATVPSPRSPHRLHPTTVGGGSLGTSARLPRPLSSRPSAQHRKAGQNR